jgi:TrmH family RNA methyltransferase
LPRASGVGAIVRQRWTRLNELDPREGLGWLVIERLRSAGNLRTILRTAVATGVAGVVFLSSACDVFDPAVVRANMGGMFYLKLVRTSAANMREWASRNGVRVVGLSPRAPQLWTEVPTDGPVALLIGEERTGLSSNSAALCDVSLRLPMCGRADSLNVAVAAGVMMYELTRSRIP